MTPEQIEIVKKYAEAWADDEGLALHDLLAAYDGRGLVIQRLEADVRRLTQMGVQAERERDEARDLVFARNREIHVLCKRAEQAEAEVERLRAEVAEAGRTAVNWHREFKLAEARLEKVVELHGVMDVDEDCVTCRHSWPCSTYA